MSEQQEPQIEERRFTQAETELLAPKIQAYEVAAASLNETLAFLRKQHKVNASEGWQLGQFGFVRQVVPDKPTGKEKKAQTPKADSNQPAVPPKPTSPKKTKAAA